MSSLLFLVFISSSGLILNHADGLGLSRTAAGPWLLNLYGVELPPVDAAFTAGDVLFAASADTMYADGVELARGIDRLVGAVDADGAIVVATGNEFFILNADAELVERFVADGAAPMRRLGVAGARVLVSVADGVLEFDPEHMNLVATEHPEAQDVAWSQPTTPSAQQAQQVGNAALGQAINWERVLLDFHSGRILPGVGRYLADMTALALLYMCFSGIVLWTRRRQS